MIDMVVEMGEEIVKEKDHLNYRYFHKRAFYLASIMYHLKRAESLSSLEFGIELDFESALRPVLVVKGQEFSIRILPFTTQLKVFRLAPGRNSVRSSVFHEQILGIKASGEQADMPTPMLNSCILADLVMGENAKQLFICNKQIPAFSAGLKLFKAWHKQRGYDNLVGGLSSYHITMLLVFMAENNSIDASMDELQILKASLKFLGGLDISKPISLTKSIGADVPAEYKDELSLSAFQKHFDLVFLDITGVLNIFWNVKKQAAALIINDAQRHASIFVSSPSTANTLLMISDNQDLKFDVSLVIPSESLPTETMNPDAIDSSSSIDHAVSILVRALTDRITHISTYKCKNGSYRVGIILNPEQAFRLVDLGPPIEDKPACAEFRAFWGDKSELRRFKDSSIKEAAIWEQLAKDRHLIVGEICRHVLKRHCGMDDGDIGVICGQLDWAIESGSFAPAISASESLSKKLRGLSSLPLTVTACETISPTCRYTALSIPKALSSIRLKAGDALPPIVPVHDVVVRMEASGKWPHDPHAAKLLKQALMIQTARCLVEEHSLETSFAKEYLDVLCDDHVFRCHLTFPGELSMYSQHGLESSSLNELLVTRPKHARAIHSLYTSNVVYGPAVRIAKKFMASQLLSAVVSEELVELLMARVFLDQGRFSAPHSSWTSFLRFLQLLAEHDWEAAPLIVNFDPSVRTPDLCSEYDHVRDKLCMFVATSYDEFKLSEWSLLKNQERTLLELCKLAAAALKYLNANPFNDLSVLFKRSHKAFTGVLTLYLASRSLSRQSQLAIRNAALRTDFLRYLPGLSIPEMLVADLKANFGKDVDFFYDASEPKVVAFRARADEHRDQLETRLRTFCRDIIMSN